MPSAYSRAQHRRMVPPDRPTITVWGRHIPRPGPAGPGPPGRGRPGACRQALESTAPRGLLVAARRPPGVCGPGRGGLPAQRSRCRAPVRRPRASRCAGSGLYPAADREPGDAGLDPAGYRRPGRVSEEDHFLQPRADRPPGLLIPAPAASGRGPPQPEVTSAPAARWTTWEGPAQTINPDYPREPGHLLLARVLLTKSRSGRRSPFWTACTCTTTQAGWQPDRGRARCGRCAGRQRSGNRRGRRPAEALHWPAPRATSVFRRRRPADGRPGERLSQPSEAGVRVRSSVGLPGPDQALVRHRSWHAGCPARSASWKRV